MPSVLQAYYAAADACDARACSALFSVDTVYVRQRLAKDGSIAPGTYQLTGRESVYKLIGRRRPGPYRHVLTTEVQVGSNVLGEGQVVGPEDQVQSIFLVSVTLDEDGLIARSLAIGAAAPVGDRQL